MKYDIDRLDQASFAALTHVLIKELTKTEAGLPEKTSDLYEIEIADSALWPPVLGAELSRGPTAVITHFIKGGTPASRLSEFTKHVAKFLSEEELRHAASQEEEDEEDSPSLTNPFDYKPPVTPRPRPLRYLIFATNAELLESPSEGFDKLRELVAESSAKVELDGWQIWHSVTYEQMLDAAPLTRLRYLATLAQDNILDHIDEYNVGLDRKAADAVKRLLVSDLHADQWVRLTQAGDPIQSRLPLDRVGIDLPLADEKLKAAQFVIAAAEESALRRGQSPSNVLLLGAPGQGKSTIAQMIAQCYRIALLKHSPTLGSPTKNLLASLERGLLDAGIRLPRYLRYPIRIELANYVEAAAGPKQTSIIKYIADRMEKRSPGTMDVHAVREWLRVWPWLLILDGLDEVASSVGRDILMEQLAAFTGEADVAGADVVIVATTRPQGYAGEFTVESFRYAYLSPLSAPDAVHYGRKLAIARYADDADTQNRVVERIDVAAMDPLTARLMRSPLQVTIMSILLEGRERAPRARYELFDAYYETIYSREISKPGPLALLLETRRRDVNALHNWLGFHLQAKSESADNSDASTAREDLKNAALKRLAEEGYDREQALPLAEQVLAAVTSRLVLIVPRGLDDVGFEVRSIQEFFAARAIVSGTDSEVLRRLGVIVEPAHWRNTWLFAAGKAFEEREHIRRDLLTLLREVDNNDSLRRVVTPGADLALDLLEDDIAAQSPILQRALCGHALELLRFPPDQDLWRRAAVLLRLAERDTEIKFMLEQAIDAAAQAGNAQQKAAEVVLQVWTLSATSLGFSFRKQLRRIQRNTARDGRTTRSDSVRLKQLLSSMPSWSMLSPEDSLLISEITERLQEIDITSEGTPLMMTGAPGEAAISQELLDDCVNRLSVVRTLAEAVVAMSSSDWISSAVLRSVLRAALQRRSVANRIVELTL